VDRREWAWAAASVLAFGVSGILAQAAVLFAAGRPVGGWPDLVVHILISPWIAPAWGLLAGASIAILRWRFFGRVANLAMAVLVLALGVGIDAAYEFALNAWAAHRLVLLGPPVFHDGLLAVAVAAFAALVAAPKGRLIPSAALLLADGWALSGLGPSSMFTLRIAWRSDGCRWQAFYTWLW
jgi:hypothetical protein